MMNNKGLWLVLALVGIAAAAGGGYWFGARHTAQPEAATPAKQERKVLYYRNPMGLPDTSPVPKKDNMGMDYVPVYADEAAPPKAERKILYYRNPMGLPDTSPTPKKDSMGMDYVPVYADEAPAGQVSISPDRVQKLGVKTEAATMRPLSHTVRAVGRFEIDENRMHSVTTKFEGWIEALYVSAVGDSVRAGQPLMQVYSPELVSAQEEYLIAWNGRQSLKEGTTEAQAGVDKLAESALKRLRYWDISDAQLERLQREGKAMRTLTIYSPGSGFVMEKNAMHGMRFAPGDILYKIADLSRIWLVADVFEQDLAAIKIGQTARIKVDAFPDKEFSGKVTFIYPTFNAETRTAQVRVELPNPGGLLKPAMFGNVELAAGNDKAPALTIPASAVLNTGTRQVVLVNVAEGRFEPREVKLGRQSEDYVEVLDGVAEGENVVVGANFLIDAESNLKAALGSFSHEPSTAPAASHEGH
nr:efflux RND transporter periplasmic adaptor subunit [Novimethylophilus kurashikiensis]